MPSRKAVRISKAIMRRMAEPGIGNAGMKAISLHSNDAEVSHYVAAANQSNTKNVTIAELSKEGSVSPARNSKCLTQLNLL
jgi:hypothetical protein